MKGKVVITIVVFAIGLAFSIFGYLLLKSRQDLAQSQQFEQVAQSLAEDLKRSLNEDLRFLSQLSLLGDKGQAFENNHSIQQAFDGMIRDHEEIEAIGILERLSGKELKALVQKTQKDTGAGIPLFDLASKPLDGEIEPTTDHLLVTNSLTNSSQMPLRGIDLFTEESSKQDFLQFLQEEGVKIGSFYHTANSWLSPKKLWVATGFSSTGSAGSVHSEQNRSFFMILDLGRLVLKTAEKDPFKKKMAFTLTGTAQNQQAKTLFSNQIPSSIGPLYETKVRLELAGNPFQLEITAPLGVFGEGSTNQNTLFLVVCLLLTVLVTAVTWFSASKMFDLSEKLKHEALLADTLQKTIEQLNRAETISDALQVGLINICSYTGWSVGHVFVPDDLSHSSVGELWHMEDQKRFAMFKSNYESKSFVSGKGLVDRVLENEKFVAITDITLDPSFSRSKITQNIGIRAAYGFPVKMNREIYAVLEFFSEKPYDENEKRLYTVNALTAQVSGSIERIQSLNTYMENTLLIKELQQKIEKGVIVFNEQGLIHSLNPRGEKILDRKEHEIVHQKVEEVFLDLSEKKVDNPQTMDLTTVIRKIGIQQEFLIHQKDRSSKRVVLTLQEIKGNLQRLYLGILEESGPAS